MVEVAESNSKVGIVGCKIIDASGKIQQAGIVAFPNPLRAALRIGKKILVMF